MAVISIHVDPRDMKRWESQRRQRLAAMARKPVVWTVTNIGPENLIVNDGQGRRVKLREGERAVFQHRKSDHG